MKDFKMPFSEDAERAMLGSILLDPHMIKLVEEIVKPDDFYDSKNKNIYRAMIQLHEGNRGIDLVTVCDILEAKDQISKAWGRSEVSILVTDVPTSSHATDYAKTVKEKSRQRNAKKIANDILYGDHSPESISKIFENFIKSDSSSNTLSLKDALGQALDQMFSVGEDKKCIPSGFHKLDGFLNGGFSPSDIYIIAARPSMGKTTIAVNIGYQIAKSKTVGIFSLEMEAYKLATRIIHSQSGISKEKLTEPEQIEKTIPEIEKRKMFFYDRLCANFDEVKSNMRAMHYEKNIDIFIVDYLQLMVEDTRNMNNEVAKLSKGLKRLARELKVPIIVLSQLSRAVEKRDPPVPILSDLRDSGAIEQDADVVMMLYRAGYYDKNFEGDNLTNLYIRKNRNGEVTKNEGGIRFDFNMDIQKFNELP